MQPIQKTVQATEEAIINALVAAETMTGVENHKVVALPHDKLKEVMRREQKAQCAQVGNTFSAARARSAGAEVRLDIAGENSYFRAVLH